MLDAVLSADWPLGYVLSLLRARWRRCRDTDGLGGGGRITRGAGAVSASAAAADARGSPALARLVASLAPRYAFGGGGGPFYARAPFAGGGAPPVRFVGLAVVAPGAAGADPASKWLHALSLVPAAKVCPAALSLSLAPAESSARVTPRRAGHTADDAR